MTPDSGPLLTLEPLIEAVREGVEAAGWTLSGMQKTTSHQFEGRWDGEATRSAYLFFHPPGPGPDVSIDVFLDETTRGLTGNLALVVDLWPLARLGDSRATLASLGPLAAGAFPSAFRTPITLRLRLDGADADPGSAETEVRFKVRLPPRVIGAGHAAVCTLAGEAVRAFEALLSRPGLSELMAE